MSLQLKKKIELSQSPVPLHRRSKNLNGLRTSTALVTSVREGGTQADRGLATGETDRQTQAVLAYLSRDC